jgi:hypothetical protein
VPHGGRLANLPAPAAAASARSAYVVNLLREKLGAILLKLGHPVVDPHKDGKCKPLATAEPRNADGAVFVYVHLNKVRGWQVSSSFPLLEFCRTPSSQQNGKLAAEPRNSSEIPSLLDSSSVSVPPALLTGAAH